MVDAVSSSVSTAVEKAFSKQKQANQIIAHSDVDSAQYNYVVNKLNLQFQPIACPVHHTKSQKPIIPGYQWDHRNEPQQANECIQYLNKHIKFNKDYVKLISVSNNTRFLSYSNLSLGLNLSGTTDLVICDKFSEDGFENYNTRIVIELKKVVEKSDTRQAVLELIAADAISQHPVVVLLTDLNQYFKFIYLRQNVVTWFHFEGKYATNNAYEYLSTLSNTNTHTYSSSTQEYVPNICKIDYQMLIQRLPIVHERHSDDEEIDEEQLSLYRKRAVRQVQRYVCQNMIFHNDSDEFKSMFG